MRFQPRLITLSTQIGKSSFLFAILFSIASHANVAEATTELAGIERAPSRVVCRHNISKARLQELEAKLRKITGLSGLELDRSGALRLGTQEPVGGSRKARELLSQVVVGPNAVVLEDASRNSNVAFMRVVPGAWKTASSSRLPAFVIQIDFADFDYVMGDGRALAAFDIGWGLLHELDHIANDSLDPEAPGETGECEVRINEMRLECGLPQRTDYFYGLLPLTQDTTFTTRLVRLAFDQSPLGAAKKKRYWIVWDANLVGGIGPQKQVAVLR